MMTSSVGGAKNTAPLGAGRRGAVTPAGRMLRTYTELLGGAGPLACCDGPVL